MAIIWIIAGLELVDVIYFRAWDYPKSVYVAPDGNKVYVANLEGQNVVVVDAKSHRVKERIEVPGKPVEIAFSRGGRWVWITLLDRGELVVYDTLIKGILRTIEVGEEPKIVRVSPDDRVAVVANWRSGDISVIDTKRLEEIKRVKVGRHPRGMAFHPSEPSLTVCGVDGWWWDSGTTYVRVRCGRLYTDGGDATSYCGDKGW